jgi:hypothetical protein
MFKKFGQAALPLLLVFAMGTSLLINQRVAHAADTIAIAMIGGTTTCTQALAEGADADDDTPADGSASIKICGYIEDADEAAKGGVPVVITVSVGVLSTGTAKSVTVISDSSGLFSTNYRGAGGVATTDTVIASYSAGNAVDTETVTLDAPTGNTAATMKFNSPAKSAIAATRDKGTLNYLSPTTKTDLTLQVTDAAGLGVNSQTVLVTVDKGFIVTGLSGTCGTAKSLTGTTATAAPVSGATAIAGVVQMTICADQDATPGAITVQKFIKREYVYN